MNYLIGTDIGTSSTKSIMIDTTGKIIAQDLEEYNLLTSKPLWAEEWPNVWLKAVQDTIRNVVKRSKVNVNQIKGIGISGLYGGSGIPLDKSMLPVRPALIWMDRRAQKECEWVKKHVDTKCLAEITGDDVVDPYYGYTKILWIKNHEPQNWKKIKLFMPPADYIIYKFTGEIAINHSAAGNIGGIYNINKHCWSKEMMKAMGIPMQMMPQRMVDGTTVVGYLNNWFAKKMALKPDIPIISGGVDVGATGVGMGAFKPGHYVADIGSSMNASLVTEKPIKAKRLITWPYPFNSKHLTYNFSGAATAGAIVKWFRNEMAQKEFTAEKHGGPNTYKVLDQKSKNVKPGSNGIVALPYFMGERAPIWNSNARGVIFGLSLSHSKYDLFHAFEEAVCYALRNSMEQIGTNLGDYIIIAGGVTHSPQWVQMFADVTGYPVRIPKNNAEAGLGDAIMAGLTTHQLKLSQVKQWQVLGQPVKPNPKNHQIYNKYYQLYKDLYQSLKGDFDKLVKIN